MIQAGGHFSRLSANITSLWDIHNKKLEVRQNGKTKETHSQMKRHIKLPKITNWDKQSTQERVQVMIHKMSKEAGRRNGWTKEVKTCNKDEKLQRTTKQKWRIQCYNEKSTKQNQENTKWYPMKLMSELKDRGVENHCSWMEKRKRNEMRLRAPETTSTIIGVPEWEIGQRTYLKI